MNSHYFVHENNISSLQTLFLGGGLCLESKTPFHRIDRVQKQFKDGHKTVTNRFWLHVLKPNST